MVGPRPTLWPSFTQREARKSSTCWPRRAASSCKRNADVAQRVKRNEIPHEKRGRRIVFSKEAIDLWASQRILRLPEQRLTEYHRKSTLGTREILPRQSILAEMIQPGYIAPALPAKTKSSVLHELVALAGT